MATPGFGSIASKYVYVYDDRIEGSDNNDGRGTESGVTYANNHWVLDSVIGV